MKETVYKWNELVLNDLKPFLFDFWNRHPKTKNKVLEIQLPSALISNNVVNRIYFGEGLQFKGWEDFVSNDINDLKSKIGSDCYNEMVDNPKTFFRGMLTDFNNNKELSINPLSPPTPTKSIGDLKKMSDLNNSMFDLFWDVYIEAMMEEVSIIPWYTKEDDKYVVYSGKGVNDMDNIKDEDRFIRVRVLEKNYWVNMVEEFLYKDNSKLKHTDLDINPKKIKHADLKNINNILNYLTNLQ